MDYPITFVSTAVVNHELYIFGAGGLWHGYRKSLKFNPETERYTELADSPFGGEDSVAVAFHNEIYVFGSVAPQFNQVSKYDPSTNRWTILQNANVSLRFSSIAVIGEDIYIVGQWGVFNKYNPATDTWTALSGAPTDLSHTSAFEYNGQMYVFGSGSNPALKARRYNPATNEWFDLADSPADIFRSRAVRIGDSVFVIGGGRVGFFNKVRQYRLTGDNWTELRDLPELTQFLQGVSEMVDENLFIFEGTSILRRNQRTSDWARMANAPSPVTTEAAVRGTGENSQSIFLFGTVTRQYTPSSETWNNPASPPFSASEADAVCIGNNFYIVGGGTNFQLYTHETANPRWSQLANLPNGNLHKTLVAEANGALYLIGSENAPNKQFRRYDMKTQNWERLPDCPIDARNGAMAIITGKGAIPPPDLNIVQIFIPAGRANRPGRESQMLYVTIHETDNTSAGANARGHATYLNTVGTTVSWHYTVDDTETVQHLPENEDGFHAGDGSGNGNRNSIAIEICVNSDGNFPKAVARAIELAADICKRRHIPVAHVVQHNFWSGKNCPSRIRSGVPFGWSTFLEQINLDTTGDAVYVIGESNKFYQYDTEWRVRANLAQSFQNGTVAVFNGEIYAAGISVSFRKYVPESNSWVALANCPLDARHSALVVIGGYLYLVGGNASPNTQLNRYDPAANRWEPLPPCPHSAYRAVVTVIRGDIYVLASDEVLCIFNPRLGLWETRQTRLPVIEGASVAAVGNTAIISGGETPFIQYTPSVRFVNQIVAEVKKGQRIFYSAGNSAVLRLEGEIILHGASVAESDGLLVTDVVENSDDFIRGWVQ